MSAMNAMYLVAMQNLSASNRKQCIPKSHPKIACKSMYPSSAPPNRTPNGTMTPSEHIAINTPMPFSQSLAGIIIGKMAMPRITRIKGMPSGSGTENAADTMLRTQSAEKVQIRIAKRIQGLKRVAGVLAVNGRRPEMLRTVTDRKAPRDHVGGAFHREVDSLNHRKYNNVLRY